MDLELPGTSGIEATRRLKERFPALKVVILTVFEAPETVMQAICAGADGYDRSSYPILKEVFCRLFSSELSCALWQFRKHDPPGGIDDVGDPGRLVKLGVVPYGSFGRVGIAKRKNPSSSKRGRGIAMAWGDMAFAHEIGHTIGLKHASKAHGEGGGGSAEGDWPYAHGSIGLQNFGVITQESTPPGDFDFGQWDVRLVGRTPGEEVEWVFPVADRGLCSVRTAVGGSGRGSGTPRGTRTR